MRLGHGLGHAQLGQVLRVDEFSLIGEFVVEVGDGQPRLAVEQLLLQAAVIGARILRQKGLDVILRDQLRTVGNQRRIAQQLYSELFW